MNWKALGIQGINRKAVANPCVSLQVPQNPSINPEALETQSINWKVTNKSYRVSCEMHTPA